MRGGEAWILLPVVSWKERTGNWSSSSETGPNPGELGIVDVSDANEILGP